MKRFLGLAIVIGLGVAALIVSQRRKPPVTPSADALVQMIATGARVA